MFTAFTLAYFAGNFSTISMSRLRTSIKCFQSKISLKSLLESALRQTGIIEKRKGRSNVVKRATPRISPKARVIKGRKHKSGIHDLRNRNHVAYLT